MESIDMHRELHRWRSADLPHELRNRALQRLEDKISDALKEETCFIRELEIELAYSLCWPDEPGTHSLVSKAYTLLGSHILPIPDDPEPIRESLQIHRDRLVSLQQLHQQIKEIRRMLESTTPNQ